MSTLRDYLVQKREALLERREKAANSEGGPHTLSAFVRAEGRSGVRRISIRDHYVISDSGPDFAGYNLGPSSPELQLGVLGSCLTHVFLIQAADLEVPLDALAVEVTGELDSRAGKLGYEHIPRYPQNINYTVRLESPAPPEAIAELHTAVERACPILNLLVNPQQINGTVIQTTAEGETIEVTASAQTAAAAD
ncbi:MAG: OsmC family protein [Thermomicrobiales bacterium]